jgi:anti-sigma regulatory factor (Ser/Thr protein kinase)
MCVDCQKEFSATPQSLACARTFVTDRLAYHGVSENNLDSVRLVVTELAANAVRHAYPHAEGTYLVELDTSAADEVEIRVSDHGVGFNDPTERGVGLRLVEGLSSSIDASRDASASTTVVTARIAV